MKLFGVFLQAVGIGMILHFVRNAGYGNVSQVLIATAIGFLLCFGKFLELEGSK